MKGIVIGAGRGKRLGSMTDEQPKCYVRVGGRRIIDWTLDALAGAGLDSVVFIGGYQIDLIRADFGQLTFCHNADWQSNNILVSLMHAEDHMAGGFVCTYADILFRDTVVRDAVQHPGDIVLCVDTHWRDRYADRTDHPEDDAEKVCVQGDRIRRIARDVPAADADGEYIGVASFSPEGAQVLRRHYHRVRKSFAGRPWRGATVFEKSYLIPLFAQMIEEGVDIRFVPTHGDYMEIDTEEDHRLANEVWIRKFTNDA